MSDEKSHLDKFSWHYDDNGMIVLTVHPFILQHANSREKLIEIMNEILRAMPSAPGIEAQPREE
jgi:hypothetical protein